MGSQVIAICKCGVNSKINIGGGMLSFNKIDYFPGYCPVCKEILKMNLKDKLSICPHCERNRLVPYNTPELIGTKGSEIIEQTFDNELTNGTYFCPKCKNMSLRFIHGGIFWD